MKIFRRFGCIKIGVKSPKMFAKFSRHFSRRVSNQVSQRLLPGVPPTSGQHGRQSVLYDNFSEDTKPEWLLWSKCSFPPKLPLSRNTSE